MTRGTRILHAFGKMMGAWSLLMLILTPVVHLVEPIPDIQYVVASQLITFVLSTFIHGWTDELVSGGSGGRFDPESGVPDDPTEILGDDDE